MAYARIVTAAEKAKCELSSSTTTDINEPYITATQNGPLHLTMTLTRAKYDETTSEVDEILLIGGMTRSLNVQEGLTKAFGLPLDKTSNPDEAVALGAVTQANILAGGDTSNDILLLDVTPISLGLETEGELMTKLIEANTTIPTSKKQVFTTAVDNQPGVYLKVLQGERQFSKDNKTIGAFALDGIAPARRGVPQIEVTFDIDANGILKVSAKDLGTGKEQHITITSQNSLSEEEINKIKADAEKYKAEDEKKRKEVDALNAAEGYAYQVRNSLEDVNLKDNFTDEQKTSLNEKVEAVLKSVKDKNLNEAETNKKALEETFNPIIQEIYKKAAPEGSQGGMDPNMFNEMFKNAAGAAGAQPTSGDNEPSTDDIQDADFDEVK